MVDPSVGFSDKEKRVLWVNTERRPWRSLTALLSFMEANNGGFNCYYIRQGFERMTQMKLPMAKIGLWSGGLRVSSNAGEQYVSGSDDFVESLTFFNKEDVFKEAWYRSLKQEMEEIEQLGKIVYGATLGYFKSQKVDGKNQAAAASNLFWQLCERKYQALVLECKSEEKTKRLRKEFARFANTAYNTYCPNNTARQLDAWAAHSPSLGKYLKDTKQPEVDKA